MTAVEASEVDVVWASLVGDQEGDDDTHWLTHVAQRQALFEALVTRCADERARVAARWATEGLSLARIADLLGVTRSRAQQVVERGRCLAE